MRRPWSRDPPGERSRHLAQDLHRLFKPTPSQRRHPGRRTAWSLACAATISRWTPASTSFASARVRPKSAMSTRPSGRLISTTSVHRPSPWAPISTSFKTQATHPPSVRERARKYPTAVAPPISRRSRLLTIDILWLAFLPGALFLAIPLVEGEPFPPMLLARRFTINPVLVIIALVFWYWMWGVPGAILATPMLAVTKIVCDRIQSLTTFGHFIRMTRPTDVAEPARLFHPIDQAGHQDACHRFHCHF